MPYPIERKFVIAIASSALFDLTESDKVFRDKGPEEYRKYQEKHVKDILNIGVNFVTQIYQPISGVVITPTFGF
jgi:5'-nucleotidase